MNVVFIHIPKTAGLYIQEALSLQLLRYSNRVKRNFKQEGIVTFGHQNYRRLLRRGIVSKEFDETAFKFAFCRNPFDRAVSHYFYARRKHPDILNPNVSFIDFTRTLVNYKATFQPQSVYIDGVDVDFIGRFENIDDDINRVAIIVGREVMEIPKRNCTEHEAYQNYYNEESVENIRTFYMEDFKRFGYNDHILYR